MSDVGVGSDRIFVRFHLSFWKVVFFCLTGLVRALKIKWRDSGKKFFPLYRSNELSSTRQKYLLLERKMSFWWLVCDPDRRFNRKTSGALFSFNSLHLYCTSASTFPQGLSPHSFCDLEMRSTAVALWTLACHWEKEWNFFLSSWVGMILCSFVPSSSIVFLKVFWL